MGSVFEDAHQHYPPLSLEEIQQRYSTLAEAIPEILFSNSPDGSCDYVSGQFEAYTGIPKKQALGFGWTAAIHPEDTERVQREWAEVVRTGEPCDIEFRLRASEGAYRWFRARTKPLRDAAGNITEWFGVCMDVDARKRAEEQLRRAHVKLRAIVQSAPLAICAIDLSGRVTIWNPAAERMFGWTQEEVMGGFLPVIMESQDFFALLERARHGEVLHGWEERRSRKDGSVIDISISLASLRDIDGFLILVEEITERKK